MSSKKLYSESIQKKLKKIKIVFLDVDGVLTDGRIFYLEPQGWTRAFHVKDGYAIKLLLRSNFPVAILSAGESKDLKVRAEFLGIPHVSMGKEDKVTGYERVLAETGLKDSEALYIADELFDLPILKRVGFAATVPDAPDAVKKEVDYVTETEGGWGAVREVIDALRKAHRIGPEWEKK